MRLCAAEEQGMSGQAHGTVSHELGHLILRSLCSLDLEMSRSLCHLCCLDFEILRSPEAREDLTRTGEEGLRDRLLAPSSRGLDELLGGDERDDVVDVLTLGEGAPSSLRPPSSLRRIEEGESPRPPPLRRPSTTPSPPPLFKRLRLGEREDVEEREGDPLAMRRRRRN